MSTVPFPAASEEGSYVSAPSFRFKQRKMLHLLLERHASFTVGSDFPESPGDKLHDSANLSLLSGGTPKCCLDLSSLSNGEVSASHLSTSADIEENGSLDSSGPQDIHLTGKDFHQDLMKGIPAQLLCSTPNALDHGHRRKDAKCSTSANKENINTSFKTLEWEAPRTPRLQKKPGDPLASPLCELENGILLESEMKNLGSPITTVPKLSKNLKLEDQEGISEDPMECSLEDQDAKGLSLKKTVPLCGMDAIELEEEDSDSEHLTGDFSKTFLHKYTQTSEFCFLHPAAAATRNPLTNCGSVKVLCFCVPLYVSPDKTQ
ncbi:M-phase inducer phosphatase 3 isoform X3 [Rattus norvegicus]|uniref:M-phase inducer phosphatase 3 isoform X3 n=1 Tax=Rattus norvegicus TaxID=10116 RepID=UPI001917783D|nr:M-phase inducer phosphatase 3 isoform X3 [Rattus norvegicus]